MNNESGFVCVKAEHEMVEKVATISKAVKALVVRAENDHHFGRFNSVKTRKRRFFKDQVISYFYGEKFEGNFPALFEPIRFCSTYYSSFECVTSIFATDSYYVLMSIRDLITEPGCTLYLTPSQALLWKRIQLADINIYPEEVQ